MTQKSTPKSSNASTRPITNLELVSYGIFIALFLAVMFVAQTEVGKSYLWLIGLALAATFVISVAVTFRHRKRHDETSLMARPVSDSVGRRLLGTALGAWLFLSGLLLLGLVFAGFKSSPWLGIVIAILSFAGVMGGRILRMRKQTQALWPYAVCLAAALTAILVVLRLSGEI